MFNIMPAVRNAGPSEWSKKFDVPPANNAELLEYLGIDGEFSTPDVSGDSRIYSQADVDANPNLGNLVSGPAELGYLAFAPASNPTNVSHEDFNEGLVDVASVDGLGTGGISFIRETSGSNKWPTSMDGTQSFIVGLNFRIDDLGGMTASHVRPIISKHSNSVNDFKEGWRVYMSDTANVIVGQLKTDYGGSGGNTYTVVAPGNYVVGDTITVVLNLDVAAGLLKICTSIPGSYAEVAWSDTGEFDNTVTMFAGYDWTGLIGQLFLVEYSGAIDAEFSEANMIHYLKYYDGRLSV